MKVTDEMVAAAMAAFEAYFQDPAHESQCDECNGEGCTPVGVDSDRDWCPKCGGPGTLNAATEEGGIRAALEAALSHAAGQDGEQCRAASGFELLELAAIFESCVPFLPPVGQRNITKAVAELRALSRGVPEGEPSRLLCWAFDNLNDMPISEEWAAEWCKQAEPLVLSGHPAIAAQRKEG